MKIFASVEEYLHDQSVGETKLRRMNKFYSLKIDHVVESRDYKGKIELRGSVSHM